MLLLLECGRVDRVRVLLLAAIVTNAMAVGATLDQAVKQLPARHEIGVVAFSQYSQAADLGNGVAWYATLGITASVLALTATVATLRASPGRAGKPLLAAAAGTVGHMLVTARAAPVNFSQRTAGDDPAALADIFDQFAALNTVRASLQVAVLVALVGGLLMLRPAAKRAVPDRADLDDLRGSGG